MKNDAMTAYQYWLDDPYFDSGTKEELRSIGDDKEEIEDRFGRDLAFGTGGMRGRMGAGTNRLNIYTVRRATQGLANYIRSLNGEEKGVAITFDSRHHSEVFAEETALCLNANGIRTYRFESLRPTPELSFAVRKLGCIAGVAITASHNPAGDNGYKVYWEDGGQITPPHDKNIMAFAAEVTSWNEVKTMSHEAAAGADLYKIIGPEMDEQYYEELLKLTIRPDILKQEADRLRVVYTPLNGCGSIPVQTLLARLGVRQVKVVAEQEQPDGDFTTCRYPNPEEPDAWRLALRDAVSFDADLVIATDPDSDRLGMMAKDPETESYVMFTGNMTGVLMADYILRERAEQGTLPADGVLLTTIVSSPLGKAIAEKFGIAFQETLTGFKYIGEQMRLFEEEGRKEFVFGYEESYGCLYGDYVRDKDAQSAIVILAEMACACRKKGSTLTQALDELYRRYGYCREGQLSVKLQGSSAAHRKETLMAAMRDPSRTAVGSRRILAVRDYKTGIRTDRVTHAESSTGLPVSDVVYYELEGGWCCVRPSGTEPKVKFYFGVTADSAEAADRGLAELRNALKETADETGE